METQKHPKLMEMLQSPGAVKNFEDGIALIATYVEVILHGDYQGDEIARLCKMLTDKLIEKRTGLIGIR